MPDSQVYRFFLDIPTEPFLFIVKLEPQLRPKVGDSLTDPVTFQNWRIMRDEIPTEPQDAFRVTDAGIQRVTDDGLLRITGDGNIRPDADSSTHNYYIQPANNPNRISTWTTNKYADDQTLKQLFR